MAIRITQGSGQPFARQVNLRIPEFLIEYLDELAKDANELIDSDCTSYTGVSKYNRSDIARFLILMAIEAFSCSKKVDAWRISLPSGPPMEFVSSISINPPNPSRELTAILEESYKTRAAAEEKLKKFITSDYGYRNRYTREKFTINAVNESGNELFLYTDEYGREHGSYIRHIEYRGNFLPVIRHLFPLFMEFRSEGRHYPIEEYREDSIAGNNKIYP